MMNAIERFNDWCDANPGKLLLILVALCTAVAGEAVWLAYMEVAR